MAQITCPACGARVPSEHVDLASKLAKCACDEVFDFSAQARGTGASAIDRRRDLAPPAGLKVELAGQEVADEEGYRVADVPRGARRVLSRRWFQPVAVFLLFFCVAWDSFLVFWYAAAFGALGAGAGGGDLLMIIFPIAHVAAGVGLTYYTAALLLNRTTIELDGTTARVRHAPLPWRGAGERSLQGLRGVYLKPERSGRGGRGTVWSVVLDTDRDAAVPLVTRLDSEPQARCIAAHVAEHAGVSGP